MQSDVEYLATRSGRTAVVRPGAAAALRAAPQLSAALDVAFPSTARVVVVDLQSLTTVSPEQVDELLCAYRCLARAGRPLILVNVQPGAVRALSTFDQRHEIPQVPLERVRSPAWLELGALSPRPEALVD